MRTVSLFAVLFAAACSTSALDTRQASELADHDQQANVGSHYVQPGQFEHTLSLQDINGRHMCSATVIGEHHVLTAASCVDLWILEDLQLVGGNPDLDTTGYVFDIASVTIHPEWDLTSLFFDHNIAVLETSASTLPLTPITLMGQEDDWHVAPGQIATLTGWDHPDQRQQFRHVMLEEDAFCGELFGHPLVETEICASNIGAIGSGSLLVSSGGEWIQAGIQNWGQDGSSVFVDTASHAEWISGLVSDARFDGFEPAPAELFPGAMTLALASNGTLEFGDAVEQGTSNTYRLEVPAGTAALNIASFGEADMVLEVFGDDGLLMATDDDGGEDFNFGLYLEADFAEVLFLEVREYSAGAATYQLRIDAF